MKQPEVNTPLSEMAKRNRSASPSNVARAERAIRRAAARDPPPTVPPPTVPSGLSTLSTETADSLPSLENDARAKIQGYKNQSLPYKHVSERFYDSRVMTHRSCKQAFL